MEPMIDGMTLSLGDELGLAVAPDCCDGEMTGKTTKVNGRREYECGDCGTVLEVDDLGLVCDIREKAAA